MVVERRIFVFASLLVVFFVSAVLWKASVRPIPRSSAAAPPPAPPPAESGAAPTVIGRDSASLRGTTAGGAVPAATTPVVRPPEAGGPSYIVLLARSEIRRRIRASGGITYLNEIVAASSDSVLHRWDSRVATPVRVAFASASVANFQPSFLDALRAAFQRWQEAGVRVRFNMDADSTAAEVWVRWRIQFEGERSGQTDLQWDDEGHLLTGTITLATFDAKGQPLGADEIRVMALHEVGHLIGLDHSPNEGDIMYARPQVRDLSTRDISTALLLYDLAPGTLRVGN